MSVTITELQTLLRHKDDSSRAYRERTDTQVSDETTNTRLRGIIRDKRILTWDCKVKSKRLYMVTFGMLKPRWVFIHIILIELWFSDCSAGAAGCREQWEAEQCTAADRREAAEHGETGECHSKHSLSLYKGAWYYLLKATECSFKVWSCLCSVFCFLEGKHGLSAWLQWR